MTKEKPNSKKINDLDALSALTRSSNYAIPILDLNDRDEDGDPKLKQVPINLLQALFKNETNLAKVATSGKYGDLKNLPQLFSGEYADLSGKPNIPSRTSELQNDSGFLTEHQDISGKADNSSLATVARTGKSSDLLIDRPFSFSIGNDSLIAVYTHQTPHLTTIEDNHFVVDLVEATPRNSEILFSPFDIGNGRILCGIVRIYYMSSDNTDVASFALPLVYPKCLSYFNVKIPSYVNAVSGSGIDVIYDHDNGGHPTLKIPVISNSSYVVLEFYLLVSSFNHTFYITQ